MKKILTLCVVFLVGRASIAQNIAGKVTDIATGKPVAYATIFVLNSKLGTTCNEEGEFEFKSLALPAKLVVSELSHLRDTVVVSAASTLLIKLKPASVSLPEVTVGSAWADLITQAYRKLNAENNVTVYSKAFYRQITKIDNEPTEVLEMIWQAKTTNAGLLGTVLANGRYAKKNADMSMTNFSFFTKTYGLYDPKADSTTTNWIVGPNAAEHYNLRLIGMRNDGVSTVVEVAFESKQAEAPLHLQGSLMIEAETYRILQFKLTADNLHVNTGNKHAQMKNEVTNFILNFQSGKTGAAALSFVKVDYHARLSRPRKNDLEVSASSFVSFYDGQLSPGSYEYQGAKSASDLAEIKSAGYDGALWQDNSVVKRTPLEADIIKSFEQKGAFGTLLSK